MANLTSYAGYPGENFRSIRYANYLYGPDEWLRRKCGVLYQNFPILARALWVPLAFLGGPIKVIIFPAVSVIGTLALPIIAAICLIIGKITGNEKWVDHAKGWIGAWVWTLLSTACLVGLLVFFTYYLPFVSAEILVISSVGVCIAVQIYRALLDPPKPL